MAALLAGVYPGVHPHPNPAQETSEAPPRTAKSMGTPKGPCGSLSASSRRDSRSAGRPPPSAAPNRATKAAVVVPPIVAGQAVVRLCGSGRRGPYPHPGTWLKCQYLSAQGALVAPVRRTREAARPAVGRHVASRCPATRTYREVGGSRRNPTVRSRQREPSACPRACSSARRRAAVRRHSGLCGRSPTAGREGT